MLIGAHCSGGIKGGIDRAIEIGADCVQVFAQSPRAWRFPEHDPADLARFKARKEAGDVQAVAVHALYLINLATTNTEIYDKSVAAMRSTVDAGCAIGADAVIFHVGSHLGAGFEKCLECAVPALESILERCADDTWLLMENSAGAGGTVGRSIDELATLFERLDGHPRLGICLDTCHLYVSGYDVTDRAALDALLEDVDARIGLDRLRALHVNDSLAPFASNRDRHANILEGELGERLGVFLGHPSLQGLPAYLEVEGRGKGPDEEEVRKLRELHERATRRRAPARKRGSSAARAAPRRTRG